MPSKPSADAARKGQMPTTHWTLIQRLASGDLERKQAALDELCQAYYYPLYCQIRRRGLDHHDAGDALHDFMARLLRQDSFSAADPERGRLRSYLLTALRHFLASRHQQAAHRHARETSLEARSAMDAAEGRYAQDDSAHHESPDRLFDRQWAKELMRRVLQQLRARHEAKGKAAFFDAIQPVLLSGGSLRDHDTAALAARMQLSPGALRTALMRLLQEYREALRNEILQTVEDTGQVEAELAVLKACFKS